jgi:heme exporter protein D
MKKPLLPRRNWLGVGLSLLVVIVSGAIAVGQVADYVSAVADRLRRQAAITPARPPPTGEAAARDD